MIMTDNLRSIAARDAFQVFLFEKTDQKKDLIFELAYANLYTVSQS